MTVEIINPEPDPSVVKEVVCKGCGVRLRYVPNDVQFVSYRDGDYKHYITCPKCNKEVNVKGDRWI